jgi:hypothetical protein
MRKALTRPELATGKASLLRRDLLDLRESLYAARLLREEILDAPVPPASRPSLAADIVVDNSAQPGIRSAVDEVLAGGVRPGSGSVGRDLLARFALACGGRGLRRGAGEIFMGQSAPPHEQVQSLLEELLETIEGGVAVEVWPPPVRAFALGFLLRLVQPFAGPPEAIAHAAELHLLSADGFRPDRMLLPEAGDAALSAMTRPDPDAYVRRRVHRLVERLGETRSRLRAVTAGAVLRAWLSERRIGLNQRQRGVVLQLIAAGAGASLGFRDYIGLHSGRRAPSLRSLQRDWKGLRDLGLLRISDDRARLDLDAVSFGSS